jgi:hypothetical protein
MDSEPQNGHHCQAAGVTANSKNGSFCGLNIIRWSRTMRVVTLARSLPRASRLPIPKHAPFAIGYTFEGKPHHYLPDVVGTLTNGKPFIAEAGMEDDKRGDRNLAKAEAARRLARFQQGTFWIGTERTLTKRRHYNLTQVDEHTMDLYVVTPDGTTVASRVHAAVLICVKTAAILGAVLALGPRKRGGLYAPGETKPGKERSSGRNQWM